VSELTEKRAVAAAAAELVPDGARVGLGTGSTVAELLPALAVRRLDIRCVATSVATEQLARELGLRVESLDALGGLDIAIDGADQIAPDRWLVKGGGAAHTREKILAAAANRFVFIVSSDKLVERLQPPVPLELLPFGVDATISAIGHVQLRAHTPPTPDNGLIADFHGALGNPREVARRLERQPGVVEHGLFPPELVDLLIVARDGGAEVARVPGGLRTASRLRVPSRYGHTQADPDRAAASRSRSQR
jgi:ribose 5-phosphate isomerase A